MLDVTLLGANVRFDPGLPPFTTDIVNVSLADGTLTFESPEGQYATESATVTGSIDMLYTQPVLDLKVETPVLMGAPIRHLLTHYGVDLNIDQPAGSNQTGFELLMELKDQTTHILSDTRIDHGRFNLFDALDVTSRGGRVIVTNKEVTFAPLNARLSDMLDVNLTGSIYTSTMTLSGMCRINLLDIGSDTVLKVTDRNSTISGSLKGNPSFTLLDLNSTVDITDQGVRIHVGDLTQIKRDSGILTLLDVQNGALDLNITGESIKGSGHAIIGAPILYQNGTVFRDGRFTFSHEDGLTLVTAEPYLTITNDSSGTGIAIHRLDINATHFLEHSPASPKTSDPVSTSSSPAASRQSSLQINGYDSGIYLFGRKIPAQWYALIMNENRQQVTLHSGDNVVTVDKKGSGIKIRGRELSSAFINKLISFQLDGGTLGLLAHGDTAAQEYYGAITIENTTIRQAKLVNYIIAFVNAIPSLIKFKDPGFAAGGYQVQKGTLEFYYEGEMLYLNAIRLEGSSTDIIGYGTVNLASRETDLVLTVMPVKDLSSFVGNIPILGFVFLGSDRSIDTTIRVTGDYNNPQITSTLGSDVLFYPLELIRRAVLWPFTLVEPEAGDTD